MTARRIILPVSVLLLLAGCATVPTGPSVMVLPGSARSFEQFQGDDAVCRQWALAQTGTTPNEAGAVNTATGATIGTVVGAALGAAIGAAAGGAAIGAATGLFGGTAIGAGNAYGAALSVQSRYDIAYMQCMYAKGNQIPVSVARRQAMPLAPPPPPPPLPPGVPPPPAGVPPPPPPGPAR